MPTNIPPQAKAKWAEAQAAKDPDVKLRLLKEFYSSFPKHKSTGRLEMTIKRQIKNLGEEVQREKSRKTGSTRQEWFVSKEGLKQANLIGKLSPLLEVFMALTGANATAYDIFSKPLTGILQGASTQIQLVLAPFEEDMSDERKRRSRNLIRNADIIIIIASDDDNYLQNLRGWLEENGLYAGLETAPVELEPTSAGGIRVVNNSKFCSVAEIVEILRSYRIQNAVVKVAKNATTDDIENSILGVRPKKVLYLPIKGSYGDEVAKGTVMTPVTSFPTLDRVSLVLEILRTIGAIRVFTKGIGEDVADRPLLVEEESNVLEVAREIHKELAKNFRYARLWRDGSPAIKVGPNFTLKDGDAIEIHA